MTRRHRNSVGTTIPPQKMPEKAKATRNGLLIIVGAILCRFFLPDLPSLVVAGAIAFGAFSMSGEYTRLRARQFVALVRDLVSAPLGGDGHR